MAKRTITDAVAMDKISDLVSNGAYVAASVINIVSLAEILIATGRSIKTERHAQKIDDEWLMTDAEGTIIGEQP